MCLRHPPPVSHIMKNSFLPPFLQIIPRLGPTDRTAETRTGPVEVDTDLTLWSLLRWIVDLLLLPCKPIVLNSTAENLTVTGTIICPQNDKVRLCLQEDPTTPPLLLIDLPLSTFEFTPQVESGTCRIALECERSVSGGGPLLGVATWTVYCNGRKVGFGSRKGVTETDTWLLEKMRTVSTGAGKLPGKETGSGGYTYLRGNFERVVGSADSESFYLVGPAGCSGHELSLFFLRV